MKISKIFNLQTTQFELDFIDINIDKDLPLFIDPFFMGTRCDTFSVAASRTLKNFFQTLINNIRSNQMQTARRLFDFLHEPNETCLGLSRGAPRGNAIGSVDGEKLFQSIVNSGAVTTGIVEDIEDFRLFIHGIDKDKISDLTTNVIRYHLIKYTQNQCKLRGIPLKNNVQTGYYWNAATRSWENSFEPMLVIKNKKIILTPKLIVSYSKKYTPKKYYNQFVLEFLQHEHLVNNSNLIQYRNDGTPFVTKKSLSETVAPYSKEFIASFTVNHPQVFKEFKDWISTTSIAIKNEEICEVQVSTVANFLIQKLKSISPGNEAATEYHRTTASIMELIFYPDLISPIVEQEIHQGRKRIDITFDNAAKDGFFFRLHNVHKTPSQYIFIECKNYSRDVANPELDQIAGRFSVNKGEFGFLLFRSAENMDLFINRCRDTYTDRRGTVIPLVDSDLIEMLILAGQGISPAYETLLSNKLREITLG